MTLSEVNLPKKIVQQDSMSKQGESDLLRRLASLKLMAFLNTFCESMQLSRLYDLVVILNYSCDNTTICDNFRLEIANFVEFPGTGAPLDLMTIERVELFVLVGLLMCQRRNLLVDQTRREGARVTSLLNA